MNLRRPSPPACADSHGLWSLWDMFKQYGYIFHRLSRNLELLKNGCEILSKSKVELDDRGMAEHLGDTTNKVLSIARG